MSGGKHLTQYFYTIVNYNSYYYNFFFLQRYLQGQVLKNSKNVQIKIREDSSTLTLIDCGFDNAGYYECKAVNELGSDKTRASLTVNSK